MKEAKVDALLNPTSVAILGARENPSGWTARIFANLQRFGFHGEVFPVNPRHEEIWGSRCYPDLTSLPSVPDHLVVMRSAESVVEILREAAAMGTRSATLYATGFSEIGTEAGRRLEGDLRVVIEETGLAVSGPNCLGNLSARARLLTLPDDRIYDLVAGPVAMVGQSGTTTPGIARTLINRGIDVGYVVTSGNETGLTAADYIDYFVTDPEVKLVFCMIEAVRRPPDFLAACRRARAAGKPVIVLKMGASEQGRTAALAHTGSLAGAVEAFDAVAGDAGAIRVESADAAINLMEFLLLTGVPERDGVAVLVNSGGVRGLSVDAADRQGVSIPPFAPETVNAITALMGEDARVSNPLDAGAFLTQSSEKVLKLVEAVRSDPGIGLVLYQEDLPPNEGRNEANRRRAVRILELMEAIDGNLPAGSGTPVALISPSSYDLTDFNREARKRFPRIAVLNEPERAFRTIRQAQDYSERIRRVALIDGPASAGPVAKVIDGLARCSEGRVSATPLSEPDSKTLLRAYGVPLPEEGVAQDAEGASALADRIGYPVVVKAVAPSLTHKSDAGAVRIGLQSADAVRLACAAIQESVACYNPEVELEGWLVAQAIPKGLELVIGIQCDPEMGPVVMFGTGGVWLELVKDVAFAAPGFGPEGAERLIERTQAGQLIDGYRGGPRYDRQAVIDALIAVGRLAFDGGERIEALDINPFVVLPEGEGAFALDALAVIAPQASPR